MKARLRMKRSLSFLFLFLVFSTFAVAQPKGVNIKADSISYTKDRGVLFANGSVEVLYKDIKITADRIIYFTFESHVIADGRFSLIKQNAKISGEKLDYFVKKDTGSCQNVFIELGKTWINGKTADLSPEQIKLTDAVFSSCDLPVPHYKMSSANLTYYSRSGWIVQNWGMLYVFDFPVFPVPTYVYDTGLIGGFYKKKNPVPLPQISSNNDDGLFLGEKFIWRLSKYSYGVFGIDYATKKGFGAEFESNYLINDSNEGEINLSVLGLDGFSWGLSHTYYFGEPINAEKLRPLLYEVLAVPPRKKYNITMDLSHRKRINYERISEMPLVTLRYIDVPFEFLNFNPKIELSLGSISEESSGVNVFKSTILTNFDYSQKLSENLELRSSLGLTYSNYGTSFPNWTRVLGSIDFSKNVSNNFDVGLGYSHYFVNSGFSPYNFEKYWFFPEDNLRTSFSYKNGSATIGIDLSYNLPLLNPRDIDYNASIAMHCFETIFTWRAIRGEFVISFNFLEN